MRLEELLEVVGGGELLRVVAWAFFCGQRQSDVDAVVQPTLKLGYEEVSHAKLTHSPSSDSLVTQED